MNEEFVKFNKINKQNYDILKLDIDFKKHTPLQWEIFKQNLNIQLFNIDSNFILYFNFINIDIVSKAKIKEIVNIFYENADVIEDKLYFTIGISSNVLINKIFDIVKIFYKTKKEVFFTNNEENANLLIINKVNEINNQSK